MQRIRDDREGRDDNNIHLKWYSDLFFSVRRDITATPCSSYSSLSVNL